MRLSQGKLAEKMGIDRASMGMIERNPQYASEVFLGKLAELFGCSVDYLLGKTDERLPKGGE